MQASITFLLGPRISCMSSQVFSLLHLATLVLSPKCLEITNFNHHQHLFLKLNSRHLHRPFLNIHSSDGLIPCAKRNEWKKRQTLFQKLAITKPYLPSLMYLLSSWKEYGIKLATDGTFKVWNSAKCINIQWSTLTIYTYERA